MTDRRMFLASLFAPLLGWLRPKPEPLNSGVAIARQYRETWPGLRTFCELPEGPITGLQVHLTELYAFTPGGIYQVFGDGTYKKLDPAPFALIPQKCTRHEGHDGPCNGFPGSTCCALAGSWGARSGNSSRKPLPA